ncbi:MAG: threonylcarbamoyl-AMP synthase [Clostridia bacterium]|nr:threonylcarbamoyl-AMP synthase [Clostridia bacterium]
METKIFSSEGSLNEAAEIIRGGGLVVFPTETVYGLGADATNPKATADIYKAKGRPSDNPLIIHIAKPEDAEKYAFTNSTYYLLAEHFMPGPMTVILPSRESIPKTTRGGLDTVAVRCPENKTARELIRLCDVAIAAPSANLSGSPSPTTFEYAYADMNGRVDAIIDGGSCDFGLESTIVTINDDSSLTLLRPGKITKEDLEALGLKVSLANAVTSTLKEGDTAISPGMKYKHYAPKAPLVLLDGTREQVTEYITNSSKSNHKIAIIAYADDVEYISSALRGLETDIYSFGSRVDEAEQAHLLFKLLRDTDKGDYTVIYAPLPSTSGIGLALYNRMIRAAAHNIIRL